MHVPKKNIEPVIVDIKKFPGEKFPIVEKRSKNPDPDLSQFPGYRKIKPRIPGFRYRFYFGKRALVGALVIFFAVVGILFLDFNHTKKTVLENGGLVATSLAESASAIKNFNFDKALASLEKSAGGLESIKKILYDGPRGKIISFLSSFFSPLNNAGLAFNHITVANYKMIELMAIMEDLRKNGFTYFNKDGRRLVVALQNARIAFSETHNNFEGLRNIAKEFDDTSFLNDFGLDLSDNIIGYSAEFYAVDNFLDGLIDILSSEKERKILLMFQNSSEIRPAGGFLGSYGVLTIKEGQMSNLEVGDIYWPDHPQNFSLKLAPPPPLQYITTDWGARDANWFFDFPKSAEVVIELLESSDIYKEKETVFEGAIALNVDVLGTLIDFIGPIEVEEYEMVVNKENFLAEIQREIEIGRDARPGQNPKKILSVLAPKIISGLEFITPSKQKDLFNEIEQHVANKDIMFHFTDARISYFLNKLGMNGAIYNIPKGFWGGYLAVVNANIAGGKTDAFVSQDIKIDLEVFTDGAVMGDLNVSREHFGGNQKDSWYNVENVNYMKIYLNPEIQLLLFEGGTPRRAIEMNYEDYENHPSLNEILTTTEHLEHFDAWQTKEFNRTALSGWTFTKPGEKSEIHVRYTALPPEKFVFKEGEKFRFVFDKQSGVNSSLDINISAPTGYVWEESSSRIFTHKTENTSAMVVLELTITRR